LRTSIGRLTSSSSSYFAGLHANGLRQTSTHETHESTNRFKHLLTCKITGLEFPPSQKSRGIKHPEGGIDILNIVPEDIDHEHIELTGKTFSLTMGIHRIHRAACNSVSTQYFPRPRRLKRCERIKKSAQVASNIPRIPPFANAAKDGAPTVLMMPARSKVLAHLPVSYGRCLIAATQLRHPPLPPAPHWPCQ